LRREPPKLKWGQLLDDHDRLAKVMIDKHRGTLIKSTGDGILATFDGPGRAVICALAFERLSGATRLASARRSPYREKLKSEVGTSPESLSMLQLE
jgi:class 3 adenylate cyclase